MTLNRISAPARPAPSIYAPGCSGRLRNLASKRIRKITAVAAGSGPPASEA
jgi:hypothetical protein